MPNSSTSFDRVIFSVSAVLLCAAAVGCLALPTRMTARRFGSGGISLQSKDVDLTFIKAGVTTRSDIVDRLRGINVNAPEQIFWGRWVESKWGVVAGSLPPLSANSNPDAGSVRHWHYRNVLVRFNDQRIVTDVWMIDKDGALWRQLLVYVRQAEGISKVDRLELSSDDKKYSGMILAADAIQLRGAQEKDTVLYDLFSRVVIRLRPAHPASLSTPELTCFQMELTGDHARLRRKFNSCTTARSFLQMLRYLDRLPVSATWLDKP